jgi:pseudaminic acid cytidylyltransferase
MSNLCIIPAREGSKRIPRKNIKDFLGKPIIAYSIEAALKSELFDEVMVSTDSQKIAKTYGAQVPFIRSDANDFATTVDVLKEVEIEYKNLGQEFENICCIYPTSPLIQISKLKEGLLKLVDEDLDCVLPIVVFTFPIWRSLKLEKGKVRMNWPEYTQTRSQYLPFAYHDEGQWYWFRPSRITKNLFTENSGSIVLNEAEVQDIDNPQDWLMAELKYENLQSAN